MSEYTIALYWDGLLVGHGSEPEYEMGKWEYDWIPISREISVRLIDAYRRFEETNENPVMVSTSRDREPKQVEHVDEESLVTQV